MFQMSKIGEMHSLNISEYNSRNNYGLDDGDYTLLKVDGMEICTDFLLSGAPLIPAIDEVRFLKENEVVAKWFFDGKAAADHFRFEF